MKLKRVKGLEGLGAGVAAALLALGGFAAAARYLGSPRPGDHHTKVFEVVPGQGFEEVAVHLEREHLVRSSLAFRLLAHLFSGGRKLHAGLYELSPDMAAPATLHALLSSSPLARLTIPEGYRIHQIADLASRENLTSVAAFEAAASSNGPYLKRFPWLAILPASASLEGFLFPDTYFVPSSGVPAQALVALMLARFGQVAWPLIRDASRPLSPFQAVTLASIVEREAKEAPERPLIAGVFMRRLAIGMPLGSDPTVEYALGRRETASHRLSLSDVRIDSPYNTYRYPGLPPGPISNPGLASLEATLHPASTSYLYFVARGDGTHQFSRSYAEQLSAQRKYQR